MPNQEDLHVSSGWEARYQRGDLPWDLGLAPPALVDLLASWPAEPLKVLVPGAGTGHDALAWAAAGHVVTAVDIAPSAVQALRNLAADANLSVEGVEGDIFDLPQAWRGSFDVIWEQTCYCAILPAQRDDYVRAMAAVLRPAGQYVGLFWNHGMEGGPPWDVTKNDVVARFEGTFEIESLVDVPVSAGTRSHEFLTRMRRR